MMSLTSYHRKRRFADTPEPRGSAAKKAHARRQLRFVVQKHQASHLHYDVRLEVDGVLKSWAVPKGPSVNPADKRLAMMVEDHPLEYRTFEGVIPEGNYGAGTVIVWDEGTYEPMEPAASAAAAERAVLAGLEKGDLKIVLHGTKIEGAYALVRMRGKEDNAWLLIKKDDAFARAIDVTRKTRSVRSNRTLAEVARDHRR